MAARVAVGLIAAIGASASAAGQNYSGYEQQAKYFDDGYASYVLDSKLVEVQGGRQWVFEQLVMFAALPDAPRPRTIPDEAALDELWAATLAQPPHPNDVPDHLVFGAYKGLSTAFGTDASGAVVGVPAVLAREGIDESVRAWAHARIAEIHWFAGRRLAYEDELVRAEALLAIVAKDRAAVADRARHLIHILRGVERIADGRPDLAYDEYAQSLGAAERLLTSADDSTPWIQSEIRQLDLAHASDDARLGREVADRVYTHDAWKGLDDRDLANAFSWRATAVDLIDVDANPEAALKALEALAAFVGDTTLDTPFARQERRIAGRYHVRAATRAGEFGRAGAVLDAMERDTLLPPSEAATLRTRIDFDEEGPSPQRTAALRAAVQDRAAAWRAENDADRARGLLHFDADAELVSIAIESTVATDGPEAALALLGEVQAAGTLAVRLGAGPVTVDEIRSLVPEDGGLLVFAPGFQVDHLFVVDGDGVNVRRLQEAHALHRERRALRRTLRRRIERRQDDEPDALERRAARMSERLFDGPTTDRIASWERVTVVGLDAWGELPIEWLPVGGERLGARLELCFAASLPVAAHLRARENESNGARGTLVALVPDAGDAARQEYPAAAALADASELEPRIVPRAVGATVLQGEDVTVESLRQSLGADVGALVLLGHGVDAPGGRPALLTHSGGLVTTTVAQDLDAPPLVVLASCESSLATTLRGGDGSDALDAAFLVGGASTVVASDVPLELDAAVLQTRAVLDARSRGAGSVAGALREARLAAPDDLGVWSVRAIGEAHRAFPAAAERSGNGDRRDGLDPIWVVAGSAAVVAAAAAAAAATTARRRRAAASAAGGR